MEKDILALLGELKQQRDKAVQDLKDFHEKVAEQFQALGLLLEGQPEVQPNITIAQALAQMIGRLKREAGAALASTNGRLHVEAQPRRVEPINLDNVPAS